MKERVFGYWTLAWVGLISNIIALPIIALVTNITLAITLGWPSAILGIISSSALLAEKKWGITLTLVSLSMIISGTAPYSIVRLVNLKDIFGISGLTLLSTLLSVLALIYWCNPKHRRTIRF